MDNVVENYTIAKHINTICKTIQLDNLEEFTDIIFANNISLIDLCNNKQYTHHHIHGQEIKNREPPEYIINYALRHYASAIIKWLMLETPNRELIQLDTQVDDDGNTPLMVAITMLGHGDFDMDDHLHKIISAMLEHPNCNPNHINNEYHTPLCLLMANEEVHITYGNNKDNKFVYDSYIFDIYFALLMHGANVSYIIPLTSDPGLTQGTGNIDVWDSLLHIMCRNTNINPVQIINVIMSIMSKAQNSENDGENSTRIKNINLYNARHETPLSIALNNGTWQTADIFITLGVVLNNTRTYLNVSENNVISRVQYDIAMLPLESPFRILYTYCNIYNKQIIYNELYTQSNVLHIDPNEIANFMETYFTTIAPYCETYALQCIIDLLPLHIKPKYYKLYNNLLCVAKTIDSWSYYIKPQAICTITTAIKYSNGEHKETECCVCYCTYIERQLLVINCPGKHWCCVECITNIFESKKTESACPMCRHSLSINTV